MLAALSCWSAEGFREFPEPGEPSLELGELLRRREPSVPEEVGDLLEVRVRREVADVVPVVDQASALPVDVADPGLEGDDILQAVLDLRRRFDH